MGVGFAAFGELASNAAKREKELELLFVGDAYRQAIGQYYESSPAGHKHYPKKGRVFDVRSGAPGKGSNGKPYAQW